MSYKKLGYEELDLSNMPYIKNKNVFKAVIFARRLKHTGMPIGLANTKAAKYYDVDVYEVAKYMGKLGANTRDKHLLTDSDKED